MSKAHGRHVKMHPLHKFQSKGLGRVRVRALTMNEGIVVIRAEQATESIFLSKLKRTFGFPYERREAIVSRSCILCQTKQEFVCLSVCLPVYSHDLSTFEYT